MKIHSRISILTAAFLATALLFCGVLLLKPVSASAAEDVATQHCPAGSSNISLHKPVTASSSYEAPGEGWAASFLTDGTIGTPGVQPPNGWTTKPGETTDPHTVAWAKVDLQGEYEVTRFVLYPRNDLTGDYGESFPVDFRLQVSPTGGENDWTDVRTFTSFPKPAEPLVVDVTPAAAASYVRLYVTGRTGADNMTGGGGGNDGKLVQLCEMSVFGRMLRSSAKLNKTALELKVGATERLRLDVAEGAPALTWTSEDESVASVASDGTVTAKKAGKTTLHASGDGIDEQTVSVTVVEKKYDFDENVTISVFWLPTKTYLNGGEGDERWDEQFKLLQDADIDWLAHVTDNNNTGMLLTTKEDNLKAAKYADKYGLRLTVADTRFGRNLLSMSEDQIVSLVEEYRNVPGVGGYYIWDEPGPTEDLSSFAKVYAAMKRTDPDAYAHLNFLPMFAYADNESAYRTHIASWLTATQKAGVEQDYIMYDFYPYTGFGTDMDRDHFFSNLDAMRKIGLDYGVKTATYLQSNGGPSKRSPSPSEIRYQAMTSLAYGYKQLSYFTWFLPTNRGSETFAGSIVDDNGVPNPDTYDAVSALNREIHALGRTLAGLDSMEVHLNGTRWGGQTPVGDEFVFQPMDSSGYTVSLMRDKKTGRNYVMLVNNDFTKPLSTDVFLNYALPSLHAVSHETGELVPVDVSEDGILHIELEAGDAVLYALPEGMDFTEEQTVDRTAADELLARAASERGDFRGDLAALDGAVNALKEALSNPYCTQAYVDALADRVDEILSAEPDVPDTPDSPDSPDDPDSGLPDEEKGGCGGVIGAAAGGGISLVLLAFALLLLRRRKKE